MTDSMMTKNDLMDLLGLQEEPKESFPMIEAQKDQLAQFMKGCKSQSFAIGDIVRRNEFGRAVFRYPSDEQIGVVVSIFDHQIIGDEPYNMNVAVVDKRGCVVLYPMYDAYLEGTGENIYNHK